MLSTGPTLTDTRGYRPPPKVTLAVFIAHEKITQKHQKKHTIRVRCIQFSYRMHINTEVGAHTHSFVFLMHITYIPKHPIHTIRVVHRDTCVRFDQHLYPTGLFHKNEKKTLSTLGVPGRKQLCCNLWARERVCVKIELTIASAAAYIVFEGPFFFTFAR